MAMHTHELILSYEADERQDLSLAIGALGQTLMDDIDDAHNITVLELEPEGD